MNTAYVNDRELFYNPNEQQFELMTLMSGKDYLFASVAVWTLYFSKKRGGVRRGPEALVFQATVG